MTIALRTDLRKNFIQLILIILPGVICLPLAAENSQQKLKAIEGQITGLNSAINADRRDRQQLLDALQAAEQSIGQLTRQVHFLRNDQSDLDQQLNELQQEKQRLAESSRLYQQQLQQLLRSAYVNGRQEKLKLFLNQQDPTTINRVMTYYDYLNRQRMAKIQQVRLVLAQLQNTSEQIEQAASDLDNNLKKQDEQLAQLRQKQKSRNQLVKKLDGRIQSKQQQLKKLEQDRQALSQVLKNLDQQKKQKQQQRQTPIAKLRGQLPWPLEGTIVYRFGQERTGDLNWDGVLIDAPAGKNVQAIHYGRVVYADWLRGYGLLIIVDHGDGIISLYGHNESLFKEVGEWVDRHDVIARVGQSGGLKRTGLYFSIRKKGKPNNPKHWCKKTRKNQTKI